ncbi:MAG: agmatinase [Deltaproteobacteria bacterium]|nr:agmatinase [Deltaproteobacteria bacterium]
MAHHTKNAPLPAFGAEESPYCPYDSARVVVLPVPYEGTVSYGRGAAQGPRAILEASTQLEQYDEELDWCVDSVGLHTLPALKLERLTPAKVTAAIHKAALGPARDGKFLLTLGGEHSITHGVLAALLEAREGRPFSVLQIDAHADLRQRYNGTPHSHACVMARAHDLGLRLVQVGIRAVCEEERSFMREQGLEPQVFWDHTLAARPEAEWIEDAVSRLEADVYLTVDVDGLDPAIMPATGTPVPGGLGWHTALHLLRRAAESRHVIGADVMELAPMSGHHAPNFLAARLAYKMLGYSLRGEHGRNT